MTILTLIGDNRIDQPLLVVIELEEAALATIMRVAGAAIGLLTAHPDQFNSIDGSLDISATVIEDASELPPAFDPDSDTTALPQVLVADREREILEQINELSPEDSRPISVCPVFTRAGVWFREIDGEQETGLVEYAALGIKV